jgi:hypothetical protein
MAVPCKEEQQRGTAQKACNRLCSALTQLVMRQSPVTVEKKEEAFMGNKRSIAVSRIIFIGISKP